MEIVKGQTEPFKRGWYSATYGNKEPTPAAVYSALIDNNATFARVLVLVNGSVPEVHAEFIDKDAGKVRIHVDGENPKIV